MNSFGGELPGANKQVEFNWNEKQGLYELIFPEWGWHFSGRLPAAIDATTIKVGEDAIGSYREVQLTWREADCATAGAVRVYCNRPLILFADTCDSARKKTPAPFPDFCDLPHNLHVFSYQQKAFAPPSFQASECATPWLLFDDRANALIISPAAHFMVATLLGDGHSRVASGFNPRLAGLPAKFSHQTLIAFGNGINRTWDAWGQSLNGLRGAKRPGNDADVLLKYLSYWTDNGSAYYYNYDPAQGYAGTLQSLADHWRQADIPVHSLQLDSWWYYKTFMDPAGRVGGIKQPKLPAGEWNRYGGLWEYKAHPFLFTNGLGPFQKSIGLPLITHNRWLDAASPYHERFACSGVAVIDAKWWDDVADYLQASGVATYEQDWLGDIYDYSPSFGTNVDTGETFVREMARACGEHGITLQYCMAYPCYFLEGSRYPNLTTIRTSDDRFGRPQWSDFLYTSRLAFSLGVWPWSDTYKSGETNNLLLSTLSGGAVGFGDAMGTEDRRNLFMSVRADGVIVKPDIPCVPLDQSYLTDSTNGSEPLLAATHTDHAGLCTSYVFAFNRDRLHARSALFTPKEAGCTGEVVLYDYFSGKITRIGSGQAYKVSLAPNGIGYYVIAPRNRAGMAFWGDDGKFVGTGKQRISAIEMESTRITVSVLFAPVENQIELHGFAREKPAVRVWNGAAGPVKFYPITGHFMVTVRKNENGVAERTNSLQEVRVAFFSPRG